MFNGVGGDGFFLSIPVEFESVLVLSAIASTSVMIYEIYYWKLTITSFLGIANGFSVFRSSSYQSGVAIP